MSSASSNRVINATTFEEKRPRIDSLVRVALKELQIPGLAVGFVADGRTVFAEGYGVRDHSDPASKVTARTLFAIGSCSKAFTTYVLSRLVDEREIAWNDRVTKYVSEFQLDNAQQTNRVTIKDIVTHATGLPRHDALWYRPDESDSPVPSISMDETLKRLPHLKTVCDVREKFMYNNFMYGIAGLVIDRASGRCWRESVRDLIFRPLGMTRSYCTLKEAQQQLHDDDIATPHMHDVDTARLTAYPYWFHVPEELGAAGSIVSTADDMTKWIRLQLSGTVPSEMHAPQMPISVDLPPLREVKVAYGLGWFVGDRDGRYVVRHSGQTPGFRSAVVLFPGENQGIVVLANIDYNEADSPVEKLASRLVDILTQRTSSAEETDEEWVSKLVQHATDLRLSERLDDSALEGGQQPDRPEQYVGRFENAGYGLVDISLSDSRLFASYNGIRYMLRGKKRSDFFSARNLIPVTELESDQYGCAFERDFSGDVCACSFDFEPVVAPIRFEKKVADELHAPQYLMSFAGTYENFRHSIRVTPGETKGLQSLIARHPITSKFLGELKPYKRNWFRLGSTPVEFVTAGENGTFSKLILHLGETLSVLKKKGN